MSQNPQNPSKQPSYFKNWISLAGSILAIASLFAFAFLVAIDAMSKDGNPYMGILTYLVAPGFLIMGLSLIFGGWWYQRRRALKGQSSIGVSLSIDLTNPRHRRTLILFGSGASVFLLLTAFGSYQTYHFTESVEFCGKTCHVVMEPEFTTYHRSSHARVACAECHIGSGASFYVKSKLSGAYQVYSVIFNKYSRPIPTPVHNLRPAQDTCERCHWPEKFAGNLDRSYEHYLSDNKNSPFTVRLLLHVGGGKAGHGQFGGIHWHMNVANTVEYYSEDPRRQVIPWVRVTSKTGEVTVYRSDDFKGEPKADQIRRMDCIDCHNRPAHVSQTANAAVEERMALGEANLSLPKLKPVAVAALTKDYPDTPSAMAGIEAYLKDKYKEGGDISGTVKALQAAYNANFFPLMKADWRGYPNNIGHKDWPGCFRCHDDKHVATNGSARKLTKSDCGSCHTLLAQGSGTSLQALSPKGLEFKHPGGELDPDLLCSDCHNGSNQK